VIFILESDEFQIILGSMFGDGGIYYKNCNIPRFCEKHSTKQYEYLKWKSEFLIRYKPRLYNYEYGAFLETASSCDFIDFREKFYSKSNIKSLDVDLLYKLRPLGMAVMYMDDGYYNNRDDICYFYMFMKSKESQKYIGEFLLERYGIEYNIYSHKNGWSIGLCGKNKDRFLDIISPYIPDCMSYKLGNLNDWDSRVKKKEYGIKYRNNNRNKLLKQKKEYRLKNVDKIRINRKEFYISNKSRISLEQKNKRELHKLFL